MRLRSKPLVACTLGSIRPGWRRRAAIALLALAAVAAWPGGGASADAPGGVIVARVGDRTVTASELARRIGQVPAFQLRVFGDTPAEVRKNFLERVIVRELLLAQGARDQHMDERDDLRERIRTELRNQMVAAVRAQARVEHPISLEDIKAYYTANAAKFNAPPRMAVWRIQVATDADARALIADFKKDLSPKHWTDVARDRSLDKTSYMRGGNIGYVEADGSSSEAGVRLDAAAVAALAHVKDGELVQQPVREGDRYSVLWKKQTLRGVSRPIELEAVPIRQILARKQTDDAVKALLTQLRESNHVTITPEELETFEVQPSGDLAVQRRPGTLAHRHTVAVPQPRPVNGELR